MDGRLCTGRIAQQISHKHSFRILHGFKIRVNKQGRGWHHHATSRLLCWFGLLVFHHGLNVTLVVVDGQSFLTHGTFGVPALVTSVRDDRVLGLALETGFDGLTLLADHMMTFAIATVKLAVTQTAIISEPGATHIILTVKAPAGTAAVPLKGVISPIVGFNMHPLSVCN